MRILLNALLALAFAVGGCVKTSMPGTSYSGPLPPLTDEERGISTKLREHVTKLAGEIGERNVYRPAALEAAAKYVETEFRKLGDDVTLQEYLAAGKRVRNIDLTIRGTSRPDEIVVVGAHYDSVHGAPGANDNATGVAAVLEMARALRDEGLPRTIRFVAFVNEEPPFFQNESMGSVVYANRSKSRGEKIVAMLTPETIGYYSDAPNSQHYPGMVADKYPKTGNFIAFVGDTSAAPFVEQCVKSFRSHTKFPSEGIAAPISIEGIGWSDHWGFTREGYPALMITDTAPFRYPHYHTTEDTPDKIDYDRTARVVAGLTRVLRELAK